MNSSQKYVFCHYMVGGMEASQARLDVEQAKAMGLDAFALNIISTDWWSTDTIRWLFDAAQELNFKLFFSLDMNHFSHPSQFIPLLKQYCINDAYFLYHDLPFVSTFWGATLSFNASTPNEGWQKEYRDALGADGIETYFVPAFSNTESGPHGFFEKFPVVDGVMNWESWPWHSDGKNSVNPKVDERYLQGARKARKTFMMSISSHQFKHMDSHQNWYRRGELNLAERIPQILSLNPDFLQIQTWNDGCVGLQILIFSLPLSPAQTTNANGANSGESHYIGNVWPNTIMHDSVGKYNDGFDHSGWQILLKSLITAYKSGSQILLPVSEQDAEGVFWYRTIFIHSPCVEDRLGKPSNWEQAEDVINVAIILSPEAGNMTINVYSGGLKVASKKGRTGLNAFSAPMKAGVQKVEVIDHQHHLILCGTGTKMVLHDSDFHNYNYVVTALEPAEGTPSEEVDGKQKTEGKLSWARLRGKFK